LKISSVFALRQQSINCIAVDPLNQKWIGTNQGFTACKIPMDQDCWLPMILKIVPLLADVIRSIAMDENKGVVYVGTDAGLTSFETLSIKPHESFSELFIFPNLFLLEVMDRL